MAETSRDATPTGKRRAAGRRWLLRGAAALCALAVASGAWWALGRPGLLWAAGLVLGEEPPAARFALPLPTGRHSIGTVELHMVDRARPDPWAAGRARELMVSVWYPAQEIRGHALAPYMRPGAAAHFEQGSLGGLGLTPERVDLEGVRTHAFTGAPVAASQEPRPVVLYSPGGSLPRALSTILVEDLASHGYIVVAIDHTHEASVVEFPDGRLATTALPDEVTTEVRKLITATRVADARFVLDQLALIRAGENPDIGGHPLPRGLAGALDLATVGMFGHSAGGFATAEAMLVDRRIAAGANLDGSMVYSAKGGVFGEAARRGLDRPFLLFGAGTSGEDNRPHTHQTAPDWRSLWERSTGWKLALHIPEGEHFTFADHQAIVPQLDEKLGLPGWLLTGMIGTVDPERIVASQRAYIAAFFDQHLRGEEQELLLGPSPLHPDVDFVPSRFC